MNEKQQHTVRQGPWQVWANRVLRLRWLKLLVVLIIWALTAVYTWYVAKPSDNFTTIIPTLIIGLGTIVIPLYLIIALAYTIVRTQPSQRYATINWYTLLLIPAFVAGVILHNYVYAMFYPYYLDQGGDEGIFFAAALLGLPIYLVVILLNTLRKIVLRPRSP